MRMDIAVGAYEDISSADVPGFTEALVAAMPGLEAHRCSIGERGGFITRLHRGTYAAHIVEHVALELQIMIGHEVGFGRTRGGDVDGEFTIVFEHVHEAVGLRAAAESAELARAERDRGAANEDSAAAELSDRIPDLEARAVTRGSRAWLAMARAENLRAAGTARPAVWIESAEAWDAVPDPWLAAYAQFRAAESALRAEGVRADAATLLRAAHATAAALGAAPLRDEIAALASRARIDLAVDDGASASAQPSDRPAAKAVRPHGLSEREIEVLALVAAGRTNGEIAERLFITRKTASVHVTHILGKLGVSNRVEAAMVAARLGLVADKD